MLAAWLGFWVLWGDRIQTFSELEWPTLQITNAHEYSSSPGRGCLYTTIPTSYCCGEVVELVVGASVADATNHFVFQGGRSSD